MCCLFLFWPFCISLSPLVAAGFFLCVSIKCVSIVFAPLQLSHGIIQYALNDECLLNRYLLNWANIWPKNTGHKHKLLSIFSFLFFSHSTHTRTVQLITLFDCNQLILVKFCLQYKRFDRLIEKFKWQNLNFTFQTFGPHFTSSVWWANACDFYRHKSYDVLVSNASVVPVRLEGVTIFPMSTDKIWCVGLHVHKKTDNRLLELSSSMASMNLEIEWKCVECVWFRSIERKRYGPELSFTMFGFEVHANTSFMFWITNNWINSYSSTAKTELQQSEMHSIKVKSHFIRDAVTVMGCNCSAFASTFIALAIFFNCRFGSGKKSVSKTANRINSIKLFWGFFFDFILNIPAHSIIMLAHFFLFEQMFVASKFAIIESIVMFGSL